MSAYTKQFSDSNPPQLLAADLNALAAEGNVLIASSGQGLNPADHAQTARAVAQYAASGGAYTIDGAAAGQGVVLKTVGALERPLAYTDGMVLRYFAAAAPGNAVVNLGGIGARAIVLFDGDPAPLASLVGYTTLVYSGLQDNFILVGADRWSTPRTLNLQGDVLASSTSDDGTHNLTVVIQPEVINAAHLNFVNEEGTLEGTDTPFPRGIYYVRAPTTANVNIELFIHGQWTKDTNAIDDNDAKLVVSDGATVRKAGALPVLFRKILG